MFCPRDGGVNYTCLFLKPCKIVELPGQVFFLLYKVDVTQKELFEQAEENLKSLNPPMKYKSCGKWIMARVKGVSICRKIIISQLRLA